MNYSHHASRKAKPKHDFTARRWLFLLFVFGCMGLLELRLFDLQIMNNSFLKKQGEIRHEAVVAISAHRGRILDRYGDAMAISTPVKNVYVRPRHLVITPAQTQELASLLNFSLKRLNSKIKSTKNFVYLNRNINPSRAEKIEALKIGGIQTEKAYKRFYPSGEISAHLLGFTNIDDWGQAGLEFFYDRYLQGKPGSKRVIRDANRRIIEGLDRTEDVESIKDAVPGKDLTLSIDQRLQYLAYRELKAGVTKERAKSGSAVVLDAKTGEVLAAVNQPSVNPHVRKDLKGQRYLNRAFNAQYEPGSTIKPFVIACALDQQVISQELVIDTSPGIYYVQRKPIRDIHDYGQLDLMHVLKKSSNVAISKIALMLEPEQLWGCYNKLGFGLSAGVNFPNETTGRLAEYNTWRPIEQATLSFGYGLSTSVLQLARAYTALADNGQLHSVTLLKREQDDEAVQAISPAVANSIKNMLEHVVDRDGTAYSARVKGYRVAGKTGTVKKHKHGGGYTDNKYLSLFVGLAPASNPRLVIAVEVDEPQEKNYYGGLVAGPIFARVMEGALRLMGIAPDNLETTPTLITQTEVSHGYEK
ncbi:MAG: penicillin-binding protein 2 [Methylococcaceae bacterium]